MNSMFIYARLSAAIETGFSFASGGKPGLLGHPWSVRLLPLCARHSVGDHARRL